MNQYFEISFANQTYTVNPLDVSKLSIVTDDRIDDGFIFQRKMLSGPLVFTNKNGSDDYGIFNSIEVNNDWRCNEIIITWFKLCNGNYSEFWKGVFTTGQGEFDKDACVFRVKPQPYDKYYCIFNAWEKKVNYLNMGNAITTTGINEQSYEFHTCRFEYPAFTPGGLTDLKSKQLQAAATKHCLDEVSNPETWKVLHIDIIPPLTVGGTTYIAKIVAILFREKITTNCINGVAAYPQGSDWVLIQDDCSTTNQAIFARQPKFDVWQNTFWQNPFAKIKVLRGHCGLTLPPTATIPPAAVEQVVYFDNQPGTYIWGLRNVSLVADSTTFFYEVAQNDDSVYLWYVQTSVGATIVSGQGTNRVEIEFPSSFTSGYIGCQITASNGFVKTLQMNLTSSANLLAPPRLRYTPVICASGKDYDLTLPEVTGATYTWTVTSGLTINSGAGTREINIEGNGTDGIETVTCQIDLGNGTIVTVENNVTLTDTPETGSVIGMKSVAPNDICDYEVPYANSTFTWGAQNGTVLSSSANTATIQWDTLTKVSSGRVIVKENSNCGCNYVQIAACGSDLNDYPYYWCNTLDQLEFDRNRLLMEVFEFILSEMDCDANTVISDFFEYNAPADTPGYVAGVNYVTGEINQVDFITICAKSDIAIHGINTQFSSNTASISELTLKRGLEILKSLFNVYWFIDDNNNLRLEHISWFKRNEVLNLTTYGSEVEAMNKYKHLSDSISKYERWSIMDSQNLDFVGAEIIYEALCVNNEQELRIDIQDVSTDLNYILGTNESISLDGHVLIANIYDGNYSIIKDTGVISGADVLNSPLSLANLHNAFHRHGRLARIGRMNNQLTAFESYRPTVEQVVIEIPYCCEYLTFNPDGYVVTELGNKLGGLNGYVKKSEFSITKQTLKLTINYSY